MVGERGHGGELADERGEVGVGSAGFEAEAMFEGDGEGVDEVEGRKLSKKVGFALFGGDIVAFGDVHPDDAGEVAGGEEEVGPVFRSLCVTLVGSGGAETQCQTHNKTHHGEQDRLDA